MIRITALSEGDRLIIRVSDTGVAYRRTNWRTFSSAYQVADSLRREYGALAWGWRLRARWQI